MSEREEVELCTCGHLPEDHAPQFGTIDSPIPCYIGGCGCLEYTSTSETPQSFGEQDVGERLCPDCGQPMLPPGAIKKPNEYDHASGCPRG